MFVGVDELLDQVRKVTGGIQAHVRPDAYKEHFDAGNLYALVREVLKVYGLPCSPVVLTAEALKNDSTALVHWARPLPRNNKKALEKWCMQIWFSRHAINAGFVGFTCSAAHELAHIYLDLMGSPLYANERAIDITAMVMGFSEFAVAACCKNPQLHLPRKMRSPLDVLRKAPKPLYLPEHACTTQSRYGYLSGAEVLRVYGYLENMRRYTKNIKRAA